MPIMERDWKAREIIKILLIINKDCESISKAGQFRFPKMLSYGTTPGMFLHKPELAYETWSSQELCSWKMDSHANYRKRTKYRIFKKIFLTANKEWMHKEGNSLSFHKMLSYGITHKMFPQKQWLVRENCNPQGFWSWKIGYDDYEKGAKS